MLANTPPDTGEKGNPELEMAQAEHEADMRERELTHKQKMAEMDHNLKARKVEDDARLKAQDMEQKRIDARNAQVQAAATAAAKPPVKAASKSKV